MTSVADPNEEKNCIWVFSSRPKRIWENDVWILFYERIEVILHLNVEIQVITSFVLC